MDKIHEIICELDMLGFKLKCINITDPVSHAEYQETCDRIILLSQKLWTAKIEARREIKNQKTVNLNEWKGLRKRGAI